MNEATLVSWSLLIACSTWNGIVRLKPTHSVAPVPFIVFPSGIGFSWIGSGFLLFCMMNPNSWLFSAVKRKIQTGAIWSADYTNSLADRAMMHKLWIAYHTLPIAVCFTINKERKTECSQRQPRMVFWQAGWRLFRRIDYSGRNGVF